MTRLKLTLACAAAALSLIPAMPALAQSNAAKSNPVAAPLDTKIPEPRDVGLPAPMTVEVDATDIARAIFNVKQTIPVTPGEKMVLLYPEWLPGKHAARGAIAELAGLKLSVDGKPVGWTRDPLNVYAFHVDALPANAKTVTASFQFLSPVRGSEGRIVVTPEMMNVQWEQVSLYPAGHYTRAIQVKPSIILPAGWTGIAAIDGAKVSGNRIDYGITSYEDFVDSPMFAGRHFAKWDLGNNVTLNVVADEAKYLEAAPEHIAAHKALVDEAVILFGSKHFDRYEFLLALTEELGGIGLEHHRSSENTRARDYFTKWDDNASERGLLPHELVHSWNGKFRRPDKLWTPDYDREMQDNLLWVYEGQTSFWDLVLGARSGMQSTDIVLGEWARNAAWYSIQPGREWRSVEDTTHDPIAAARKPRPWVSWSRTEDYYNEGSLMWLEADMTIRELSKGRKSLDDFANAFFGMRDGDWGTLTYDFDEVVATLNSVQPHDWAAFLDKRMRQPGQPAPVAGIEKGGYRLVFKEEPNAYEKELFASNGGLDLTHSLGMSISKSGEVGNVVWNSPAFRADIVNGTKIVAVAGMKYEAERLRDAITAAKDSKTPIRLLLERDGRYRDVEISYSGGLRYPHLEKSGNGESWLEQLLAPRR